MYNKISKSDLFLAETIQWNPTLIDHIQDQIDLSYDESDAKKIGALPDVIQHLFYISAFDNEAGGSGIEGFVLQSPPHDIKGAYLALQEIGLTALANALGWAIALTIDADEEDDAYAEYRESQSDLSWFEQFSGKSKYTELDALDSNENVFDRIENELEEKVVEFVLKHMDEIAI